MTPTLDTDLRALRISAELFGGTPTDVAWIPDRDRLMTQCVAAEQRILDRFADLSARVHTLEQENARLRGEVEPCSTNEHTRRKTPVRGES